MISVPENGFLDNEIHNKIECIKEKYSQLFDILYDYNKLSYKVIDSFKGIDATEVNQYILPAFVEVNKLYQSSIIMLEYGLKNSFESMLRNMLELWIQICYVFYDNTNIKRLEKHTYQETMRKLDFINKYELYDVISKDALEKIYSKLKLLDSDLEKIKLSPNIRQMCENLDLIKEYAYYSFSSDYIHSDFNSICSLNIFTNKGILIDAKGNYNSLTNDTLRLLSIYQEILEKIVIVYTPNLKKECMELLNRAIKIYKKEGEE